MSAAPPRARAPAPTVLVVEDNPDDLELTLAALHDLAGKVLVARDGVEALDYLFGRGGWSAQPPPAPDLVLLDLKLPRLDGMQVLRALREDPRTGHLRVVVLTSSDEACDQEGYRQFGVADYARKIVDFSLFRSEVRRLWPRWTEEVPESG